MDAWHRGEAGCGVSEATLTTQIARAHEGGWRVPHMLSAIAGLLAALASTAGLLVPGLYAADTLWASAQCRGNDAVTLAIAVPVLLVSITLAARGSVSGRLVWLGMLAYLAYGYAFYLFGVALNVAFLAYVAIVAISLYVLVAELVRLPAEDIARRFSAGAPVRAVAGYLLFVAGFLGLMWSARVIGFMASGEVPSDVVSSGVSSAIVYAMDLALLVPALAICGVMLWRRRPWGLVLGTVVLAKCTAYPLALLGMGVFAAQAGVEADYYMMGFWLAFSLVSVIMFARMLGALKGTE